MISSWLSSRDREVALIIILSFVSVAIASGTIVESGDVELKWLAIKAWASLHFPSLPANHHNLRWSINFPATLFVFLFGDSPRVYMTFNYLVFSLGTAGLYRLVREMTSARTATAILAVWLLNPTVYSLASNLMPEVFGIFYLVAALTALRAAYLSESRWTYGLSIFLFFLAYGAKESNIFFMPGLGLYELLRKKFDHVLIIIAVFGAGLTLEIAFVDILLREHSVLLGRAEVIASGRHFEGMRTEFWGHSIPLDMFRRWWFDASTNLDRLEYYSKFLYFVFFGQSAWYINSLLRRDSNKGETARALPPAEVREKQFLFAVLSIGLSFTFFTTFFVISLHPFVLGQPISDRYLWVLLVPALLLLSQLFDVAITNFYKKASIAIATNRSISGLHARLGAWLRKHSITLILIAIFVLGTFSRILIDKELVKARRVGFALPYSYFNVNEFYRVSVKQRLLDGCTLVFATPRAAWSALIFAFPYQYFKEPVQLYDVELDQLHTQDGGVIRGWQPSPQDWVGLAHKLYVIPYVRPEGVVWEIYAIRLLTDLLKAAKRRIIWAVSTLTRGTKSLGMGLVQANQGLLNGAAPRVLRRTLTTPPGDAKR